MSISHPTAIRNNIADLVVGKINGGTDYANGILIISQLTPTPLDLVTIDFASRTSPGAFGAASSGVATANSLPLEGTIANTGTAQKAYCYDCTNPRVEVCELDVSDLLGSGDLKLSNVSLTAGNTVRITALTYTAPV